MNDENTIDVDECRWAAMQAAHEVAINLKVANRHSGVERIGGVVAGQAALFLKFLIKDDQKSTFEERVKALQMASKSVTAMFESNPEVITNYMHSEERLARDIVKLADVNLQTFQKLNAQLNSMASPSYKGPR